MLNWNFVFTYYAQIRENMRVQKQSQKRSHTKNIPHGAVTTKDDRYAFFSS